MVYSSLQIVDVTTGTYTVQVQSETGQRTWRTCMRPHPQWTHPRATAVFQDIMEAEKCLSILRNMYPDANYRMTQTITITQVVYA